MASATLSHLRDPSDIVIEMALRQEEVLESLEKSKAKGVQVGPSQKRKFFPKKVLRRVE